MNLECHLLNCFFLIFIKIDIFLIFKKRVFPENVMTNNTNLRILFIYSNLSKKERPIAKIFPNILRIYLHLHESFLMINTISKMDPQHSTLHISFSGILIFKSPRLVEEK